MADATGVLYLSYTGMLEPLGQSQVLAYLERLAGGREVHLLSFERAADLARADERERVDQRMRAAGIRWHVRRYHKHPSLLATAWDVAQGVLAGRRLVRRHRLGILHARSYVPALMALWIKRATGARFLFDMRGFWADERVDGGLWPRDGRLYRWTKALERTFLREADHVVSLTHAGVRELHRAAPAGEALPPTTVIPTCADLDKFRPLGPAPREPFVLGYVGSAGTWYVFDAAVAAFAALLRVRPGSRFLIVNREAHAYIRERLAAQGIPDAAVELRSATHAEVPVQMARMHAGVFFITPAYSKQASAPTKLGEFLGCGIPCLANAGVGDMAAILEDDRVGVAVESFAPAAIQAGVRRLLALVEEDGLVERCVGSAERHFSLVRGAEAYEAVYRTLSP